MLIILKVFFAFDNVWIGFGRRLVCGVLSSMSDTELNTLEQSELYRRSPALNRARLSLGEKTSPAAEKSVVMELHKIPKGNIGESTKYNK